MAAVIKGRRPVDPTRIEIEQRKAEINSANGWDAPPVDPIHELNQLLLQQCDDEEDWRLPAKVTAPAQEPIIIAREMSREDRCNIDLSSLHLLNLIPESLPERYAFGDIDPETTDLSAGSLADLHEAAAKPIAFRLKTEKTHRDVRSFRSKRK